MKYFAFFILLATTVLNAQASGNFRCEINYYGDVELVYDAHASTGETQLMVHAVGQERDWTKPYAVRQQCDSLRQEVGKLVSETWTRETCAHDGPGTVRYRAQNFELTNAGARLIGRESNLISFFPRTFFPMSAFLSEPVLTVNPEFAIHTENYTAACNGP